MKKISKALALSLSALLLLAGCNNNDSTDLVEDETELTDNSGNGADGSSDSGTKKPGTSTPDKPSEPSKPVSYEELPVVPKGNSLTKINGAGIWIYVDNTNLGITGDNKDQTTIDVTITDTDNDTNVSYKNAWWDDFNDNGTKTVRLFIQLDAAHNNLEVDVKVQVNGVWYAKTVTFKNCAYEFEYKVTEIKMDSTKSLKSGKTISLQVRDELYDIDVTSHCTWSITSNGTGSTIDETTGLITAGDTEGTETITATYSDGITCECELTVILEEPRFLVNLNTAVNGAWLYIDVTSTLDEDVLIANNSALTSVNMTDIQGKEAVGVPTTIAEGNGVRFGYGFANAEFQNGVHTLTFTLELENNKKVNFTVTFEGTSGQNKDMKITSVSFSDVE